MTVNVGVTNTAVLITQYHQQHHCEKIFQHGELPLEISEQNKVQSFLDSHICWRVQCV